MTDQTLPPDEMPDAVAEHHRDLDGPQQDTSGEVEAVDVEDAEGEDAPDDDSEDDDGEAVDETPEEA